MFEFLSFDAFLELITLNSFYISTGFVDLLNASEEAKNVGVLTCHLFLHLCRSVLTSDLVEVG